MAITWRSVVLVLLGLAPVAVWPSGATVRWWLLAVALLIALDVLLASRPGVLDIVRSAPTQVRLGERTTSTLWITNTPAAGFVVCWGTRGLRRQGRWMPCTTSRCRLTNGFG